LEKSWCYRSNVHIAVARQVVVNFSSHWRASCVFRDSATAAAAAVDASMLRLQLNVPLLHQSLRRADASADQSPHWPGTLARPATCLLPDCVVVDPLGWLGYQVPLAPCQRLARNDHWRAVGGRHTRPAASDAKASAHEDGESATRK